MTLIADRPMAGTVEGGAAFATPTIIHFSVVLLLSAVLRAPWRGITPIAVFWGLVALLGVVYSFIVARRMRRQVDYKPEFEDWLFHAVLPLAAYAVLVLTALVARSHLRAALFGVGAAVLLLLFIGIHNAWDAVVYHVLVKKPPNKD